MSAAAGPAGAGRRAFVSGGAGFIGSHLCASLLRDGVEVVCADNLLTCDRRNIAALVGSPGFTFLEVDVTAPFEAPAVDYVYHLASPASVPLYTHYALETLRVNSQGTWALLDLARRHGAGFLFASTSEIYGNPLQHPQQETYWGNVNPNGPRSCYDESKRFGEALVMQYHRSFALDARVVRIFNTYGPHNRPDDGRVVPNFVTQALRGEPLTVYGDGNQTRSFCYVSDLVAGLRLAMETPHTAGEVFNLGNPDEYTIVQFAEVIMRMCGSAAGIIHRDLPVDDPERRKPDITRARTLLGWQPRVDLETGIGATVDWFRDLLLTPSAEGERTAC
ncbi:MAG: SDR family oxidoreductase [Chloroflexota bacterium]